MDFAVNFINQTNFLIPDSFMYILLNLKYIYLSYRTTNFSRATV